MVVPPLPADELMKRADFVCSGRVLAKNNGRATVLVRRIIKGHPHDQGGWLARLGIRRTIVVRYEPELINPLLGDWTNEGVFKPGNRVLAHLFWSEDSGCYQAVWLNGVDVIR